MSGEAAQPTLPTLPDNPFLAPGSRLHRIVRPWTEDEWEQLRGGYEDALCLLRAALEGRTRRCDAAKVLKALEAGAPLLDRYPRSSP